jgi:hypothetical protein
VAPAAMSTGRALSTAFGLLMVAAAALAAEGLSLVAAALAVLAVVLGVWFAAAATLAVSISVVVAVLADAPAMVTAVAGLAATAYLVLRHVRNVELAVAPPTVVGALGFSVLGLGATAIPVSVPWLPLAAPVAVLVSYLIVVAPLLGARR